MSLSNKDTKDTGQKILRSTLSQVYKAALDKNFIVEGKSLDETDIEEPSIIIRDLSDQSLKGFDENAFPADMVDIGETVLAGDRILSHAFSLDLDLNTLLFMKETMKSLRIEKEIENQLGHEVLKKFYQTDPDFLDKLMIQLENNFNENFSKIKSLGLETSFFNRMNLSANKSSAYYGNRLPGTVDYDFLEAEIDDIHRAVYTSNFGPYTLLFSSTTTGKSKFDFKDQYKEEFRYIYNDIAGRSSNQRFIPGKFSPHSFPPPHSKATLTSLMYQHLHDASFSLNHGVSPYSWNKNNYQNQELSSGDSHNDHRDAQGNLPPLLVDLGYNKDLDKMRSFQYPSRDALLSTALAVGDSQADVRAVDDFIKDIFKNSGTDTNKKDFILETDNITLPAPRSGTGPSLTITSKDHPGTRAMKWIDQGEPHEEETPLSRLGRIASVIATEMQLSAGISSLPSHLYDPEEGNKEPLGKKIFGEFKERINLLDELSTKSPGILLPNVQNHGDVYFYERALRFKDFQGASSGKDLTTEYITPYVAATRRSDREKIVNDLKDLVESQDERAKTTWDRISKLNQYTSNEDLLSDEQLDQMDSVLLHTSSRRSLLASRSPEHVMSIILEIFQSLHQFDYYRRKQTREDSTQANLPKRILAQMHGLMLTSKNSNNNLSFLNKEKLRNSIVTAIVNRDMTRAIDNIPVGMELGQYPNEILGQFVTNRRIGYTKSTIRRHTAQILLSGPEDDNLLDSKIARTDNLRYNIARYTAWSLNQGVHKWHHRPDITKVIVSYTGNNKPQLDRNQPESAVQNNNVGDFVAYIGGDILENAYSFNSDGLGGNVSPSSYSMKYDLYDMIIRAVDRIDESIARTVDASSSESIVDSEVSESDEIFGNYFHSSAGITRASGFDRSLIISLVVDAVSEILGDSFNSNLFVKYENGAKMFTGFYDEGNVNPATGKRAYNKACAIEIFPKGTSLSFFRNRKSKAFQGEELNTAAAAGGGSNGPIKWPYEEGSDYPHVFRTAMTTEKVFASISCLGDILNPSFVHQYMKNGRIGSISEAQRLWKACVVELMLEGPFEYSRTSLKTPPNPATFYTTALRDRFRKIFGPSNSNSYNLLGASSLNNFAEQSIGELASGINGHKGSLKSVTEFINLHASYVQPIKRFIEAFSQNSLDMAENYPDHLACSYASNGQLLKSFMRLQKMSGPVSAFVDEDDNSFFREKINSKMWSLIEKFLNYSIDNISEFDHKKVVFYGTTPGSFYESLSNFTDESPEFGSWPTETSYVPIKTVFNIKKTNPLDENITFTSPEEGIPDIDLNVILDETTILSNVTSDANWEDIADSVTFISPTQIPSFDKIPNTEKGSPASILSYVRNSIGFSVNSILDENQTISDEEVDKLRDMARRKLGDFCYKFLINSIYSLELRDEKIIREGAKGMIKNPSVDGDDFISKFKNSLSLIDVSLKDVFEKLTTDKVSEPKGFDGSKISQSKGERRARRPMDNELKRSLRPSAKISDNGTPFIAPPDLNDQEFYIGEVLFSSLMMYDHRLLFGTPLFDDIVSVEFDSENTLAKPVFEGIYLSHENGRPQPHPGLEDMANSRTVKVIRPEVTISLQSLSSII